MPGNKVVKPAYPILTTNWFITLRFFIYKYSVQIFWPDIFNLKFTC